MGKRKRTRYVRPWKGDVWTKKRYVRPKKRKTNGYGNGLAEIWPTRPSPVLLLLTNPIFSS